MNGRRVDANQAAIVRTLRGIGASVQSLAMVGAGVPDLLVGFRGVNTLLEVKDGAKSPSAQQLTQPERQWHSTWQGQVVIVRSVEEALAAIGAI